MSGFSGSERAMRRTLPFLFALLGILTVLTAPCAGLAKTRTSNPTPTRITIQPTQITVTSGDPDSLEPGNRRVVVVGPQVSVDDQGEIVRVFSDVVVPAGQRVDGDVVTIFGSSRIEGHVAGNAVSVCGSLKLGPHASVDGDVVAILGVIDRAEGAIVGGESVDIGVMPPIPGLPTLPAILLMVGLLWLLSLIGGWIVSLVMPGRLLRITATASRRTTASLLLGIVSFPMVISLMALLCITVIGIPVAVLLPLAFVLVVWIGQYAGVYGLGLKLLRRRLGEGSMMAALAVGTLFVSLFFVAGAVLAGPAGVSRTIALFLVSVGSLFGLALSVIGTGAVLLSKFGQTPADAVFPAEMVTPPVSSPAPGTTPPPLSA